jgi:hypothetical protein
MTLMKRKGLRPGDERALSCHRYLDAPQPENGKIIAGQVFRYHEDPAPGRVSPAGFAEYLGTYELAPGNTLTISTDEKQSHRQRGDRPGELLIPEAAEIFFRKGVEGRLLFRRNDNQIIDALTDRRNSEDIVWKKIKWRSDPYTEFAENRLPHGEAKLP